MRIPAVNVGRVEDAGLHLVGRIGRCNFVHADRYFAGADLDAAFGLAQSVHQHENLLLAGERDIAVGVNIVYRWRLRQAGQEGRFGKCQLVGSLAEIRLGGSFDPISQVAVIDLVQVQLENLILCIAARDFRGQDDLAGLAGIGALGALLGR